MKSRLIEQPAAVVAPIETRTILGTRVNATSYDEATARVMAWAFAGESRYVCLGVVASIMGARHSPEYRRALDAADLVTPDGMPLVWMLRSLGVRNATRVYGPDLMPHILREAEASGVAVGFYGSTAPVLRALTHNLLRRFPDLNVSYAEAPPFRKLTPAEDEAIVQAINSSGARILFVGLGGEKQDVWMAAHRGRVNTVMLGVGAAFDFLAGTKPQAPRWMQNSGLEWLFRLASEPRRLWRRYLLHNPRFAVLALAQIVRTHLT